MIDLFVGRTVKRLYIKQEIRSSNLGPVKSNTVPPTARHRCRCLGAMTRRRASPIYSTFRGNTASIMKDLIHHIPVVFFQFIILIVLTSGAKFTVWKKGTHHIIKLETYRFLFSSWFICSRICWCVQSACLFSLGFTRSTNTSN